MRQNIHGLSTYWYRVSAGFGDVFLSLVYIQVNVWRWYVMSDEDSVLENFSDNRFLYLIFTQLARQFINQLTLLAILSLVTTYGPEFISSEVHRVENIISSS